MKNNGKSPTFKFVSGEERRPSEVQRLSRGWRLPGATHSSADLTWIWKWLKIQAPELSDWARKRRAWAWELLFRLRQTSIGWDTSDSEETIWDPISSLRRIMPPSDFVLDSSRSSFSQTKKNWPERLLPGPSTPQTLTQMWNSFSSELPSGEWNLTLYRRICQLLEGSSLAFALKEQYVKNYKRYHRVRHTVGKVFSLRIQRWKLLRKTFSNA